MNETTGFLPQRLDARRHRRAQNLAALTEQVHAQRRLQFHQIARFEQLVIAADLGQQALLGRHRQHLLGRQPQDVGRIGALRGDLQLHLLGRTEGVPHGVDLVEHHQTRLLALALHRQMLAPDRQVGLGHTGVGRQDEHHRMCLRQQTDREFGLGADGVEARGVQDHQALLEQRVRHVDQRVAPFRHLDQAVRPDQRVVVRQLFIPETQRSRFGLADAAHLGHFLDRTCELLGIVDVQVNTFPFVRGIAPVQQGLGLQPRLDGQQPQAGWHFRVVPELGRTHRGAPGARGHDAPAITGKKHRIDQLGLAARELGHEGHHDLVVLDLGVQLVKPLVHAGFHQVVIGQPFGQQLEPQSKLPAPCAVVVKFLVEAHVPCSLE